MTDLSAVATARRVIAALVEGGVRLVVLCPGSRSAPLAYALAEAEAAGDLEVMVRIDERSAAFTALGAASAGGRPAAVATTSGTAVGNLMPAVMEADHAAVPLVVLSADRPEELHGTGANQTTDQVDLFGEHVRFAAALPAGQDPVRAVRTALDAAAGVLPGVPAGPVQLNLSFRAPLVPPAGWQPPERTPTGWDFSWSTHQPRVDVADGARAGRAVVLAGHDAGPVAEAFARSHGLPLLAEPSSNARFGPHAVGPYRLLLDTDLGHRIERVVLFGRPTLSRPVTALLARDEVTTALYHPVPVAWFEPGRRRETLIDTLEELSRFAGTGAAGWHDAWRDAAVAADTAVAGLIGGDDDDTPLNGPVVARRVWTAARGQLLLGSSNPIRDADLAASPGPEPTARIFANRGLAGIDGTVSTAVGLWRGGGRAETTALLGDVTFLHDVGGLWREIGETAPALRLVVLNDRGGAIFGLLEHGEVAAGSARAGEAVERLFGTPHAVDVAGIASAYGVRHTRVTTTGELAAALEEPPHGVQIVEAVVDRRPLRELQQRLRTAVAALGMDPAALD